MIYTKQLRFSKNEMERILGIDATEGCLKIDFYYDRIHEEWVFNCLVVSADEVVKTLFPDWELPEMLVLRRRDK